MKFFQLQSEVGGEVATSQIAIPLKKPGMRYTSKRTRLEVSTTLKSIFNKKKVPPPQVQVLEKASLL